MKNIFALAFLFSFQGCSKFSEVKTTARDPQAVSQLEVCKVDGSCVAYLAWDANPGAEQINRYLIEYGETSRSDSAFTGYTKSLTVNNQTQAKLMGLAKKNYFISIRAMNVNGQLSSYAPEISLSASSMKDK